ncbi:MAG: glycine cleavage system protein GcvH [Candidatus Kapabacteria bacterium]|nr:glycine cleavage system protein GcvH [Candidatus Kapabacteria bacterium]
MNYPNDLFYTNDHEWLRIDGTTGTIGVTDHAQGELGDVVYVDIDSSLGDVCAGDTLGTIEAVKTVADILSPVSGKVIEINNALNENPEVVNKDPYGEGWMIKIELSDPAEADKLMKAPEYMALIGE